jgi:hypothetical protein
MIRGVEDRNVMKVSTLEYCNVVAGNLSAYNATYQLKVTTKEQNSTNT